MWLRLSNERQTLKRRVDTTQPCARPQNRIRIANRRNFSLTSCHCTGEPMRQFLIVDFYVFAHVSPRKLDLRQGAPLVSFRAKRSGGAESSGG